jgi:hypothetical protein
MKEKTMIDKRTVTTDALDTLGMIITEKEGRDAIHLAVENVVAAHVLNPGDHVGFIYGGVGRCNNPVGIVDPFLKNSVEIGQRVWLIVYPREITSLRHVWTHPSFPSSELPESSQVDLKRDSERYIADFASELGCNYLELIEVVADAVGCDDIYGDSLFVGDLGGGLYENIPAEFWRHFKTITGKELPKKLPTHFSCSC